MGGDDFEARIQALTRPEAWGAPPGSDVQLHRTHLSAVFLVGERAYKIKRPVDLGFVDFRALAQRQAACLAEVRLNRRLAPGIYLGCVGLRDGPQGLQVQPGPAHPADEWAVQMVRLDPADSLSAAIERGTVRPEPLVQLAGKLARMYRRADRGPHVSRFADHGAVAARARENFAQSREQIGQTVHHEVFQRTVQATEAALEQLRGLFDARAARQIPRDTHGDLRAEHVYLRAGGPVVIDCVEFSSALRYADPVSDLAFLLMDLQIRGRADLAHILTEAWVEQSGDAEGRALIPFYKAYRSVVRAKVEGMGLAIPGASDQARVRRHWLYALATLEPPDRRPALLGIGGLPGTGKSTLARELSERAGFSVIRSDLLRKQLQDPRPGAYGQGAYRIEARDQIYQAMLQRAEALLLTGGRVLLDASFAKERWRHALFQLADHLGVPGGLLLCELPRDLAHQRLAQRRADPSDADVTVHLEAERRWEPVGPQHAPRIRPVPTHGSPATVRAHALDALASLGLAQDNAPAVQG